MSTIFKINKALLSQIEDTVEQFGIAIVHGCGNIYIDRVKSNDRKEYSDYETTEATYRVTYKRGDKLPKTVEELDKDLHSAKKDDLIASKEVVESNNLTLLKPRPKVEQEEEAPAKKGKQSNNNKGV